MTPTLKVSGVHKAFGAVVVANDVNFTISKGECIGVIGPNGAGKSSLFSLIAGSLRQDAGEIWLNGENLSNVPAHKRVKAGIGRAFQIPQPFAGLSVYENVLSASAAGGGFRGSELVDWTCSVLDRTGLRDKADTLAGALTLLDRKNLEVAKAVATNAHLLMLDEIGAGLTDGEVARLVEQIAELKQDHAIIWIEHIAHALKRVANRIIVLNFGELVADGPPDDVMASPIVREIYMGLKVDDAD